VNKAYDRKLVVITPPNAIVDNAAYTTAAIDTQDADFVVIHVMLGPTDIAMAALKVQESDLANMSGAADIVGTRFGTDNNDTGSASTLPDANADNTILSFYIDKRGRKRYLDLVATAGDGSTGTYLAAWAELWRMKDGPRTAAEAGYGQRMIA
jgi:hypothetical protein